MGELDFTTAAGLISKELGTGVVVENDQQLVIEPERLAEVAQLLRDHRELQFDYLSSVTAVDHKTYFEVVYHLTSLTKGHRLNFRTVLNDREKPALASVTGTWRGADLQEREIFDFYGIEFTGHPNLKRLFLWDGFPGYPFRKDWVSRDS